MERPLIVAVGTALYGSRWQSELARALGVSDRTVRRWAAGAESPRVGVYDDILELVRQRISGLTTVAPHLQETIRQMNIPRT